MRLGLQRGAGRVIPIVSELNVDVIASGLTDSMLLSWVSWITSGESIWTSITSSGVCQTFQWILVKAEHGSGCETGYSYKGAVSVDGCRSPPLSLSIRVTGFLYR